MPPSIEPKMAESEAQAVSDEHDLPPNIAARRRVHYFDAASGEESARHRRPSLSRHGSSLSINSAHSTHSMQRGNRTIDPALTLPVAYRTVSYNIEHDQAGVIKEAGKAKRETEQLFSEVEWHLFSHEEVYKALGVDPGVGLSQSEVKERVSKYGRNAHSPPPSHLFQRVFWYFFGGFGTILLGGSILVFVSWKPLGDPPQVANLALAIVLLAVFFIQALFNAWQDFSSSRVMSSITGMLPEECVVLRDGAKDSVQSQDIVPGDILFFKAGSKMPADVRFLEVSSDARFDRGILTGESLPVTAVVASTEPNYLETRCIGLQGTHCTSGSGIGVVVSIGDGTVFGHIAKLTTQPSSERTNLQKEVLRFVIVICTLMAMMCLVVIGVWAGYIRKKHPDYMPVSVLIIDLVSVAIAFIPEGLPIALTASLTIVANTMKRHQILCKSLKTVETLGSVSVLLSDKTGTLTKNQMVATDCLVGHSAFTSIEAEKVAKNGGTLSGTHQAVLRQLQIVGSVCNAGDFDSKTIALPISERKIFGDATDQAILRFSELLGSVAQSRSLWRKRFELPFNSKNKYAMQVLSAADNQAVSFTLSHTEAETFSADKDMVLMIKGAPDVLMPRCSHYMGEDGAMCELDVGARSSINSVKDAWSRDGKRVLLLARKVLHTGEITIDPGDGDYVTEAERQAKTGLTAIGLIAMTDPPREEIPGVIRTLRDAGVRTMMVTGDFKLTAEAIARDCGIITCANNEVHGVTNLPQVKIAGSDPEKVASPRNSQAIVLSGSELPTLTVHQWSVLTQYPAIVFARTTPDQKLLIVQRFRAAGYVTAMTGDGINDAPSLKEADIGIAPGSGSDIAMEASDMVLLESFSSIIPAVAYGRTVFVNLKKTVAYLLPAGSYSEFWPVLTSVVFGLPQILSSFLMIIICCFTDCAAAIALTYEKPEADLLLRPPRDVKKDHLVDWRFLLHSYIYTGTLEAATSFAWSYWYLQRKGITFGSLWFSFGSYSDNTYVTDHLAVASGIYFVTLVVLQFFNLMGVRTRRLSLFHHPPLGNRDTRNWTLFPAIVFAIVVAAIFVYVSGVHNVATSGNVPAEHWFLPAACGVILLAIEELRKAAVRRWPHGWLARLAW